jgi:hypothetical protein
VSDPDRPSAEAAADQEPVGQAATDEPGAAAGESNGVMQPATAPAGPQDGAEAEVKGSPDGAAESQKGLGRLARSTRRAARLVSHAVGLADQSGSSSESGQTGESGQSGESSESGQSGERSTPPLARVWQRARARSAVLGAAVRTQYGQAGVQPDEVAGATFARLTVLPTLLIIAWLLPGLPLLLAGSFQPLPELLISVPLAVALVVSGLRLVPSSWPRPVRGEERGWVTWFGLLATVAVLAGLTAWQLAESSGSVVVLRDPGTYLQTGYWIAQHGSLPIPQSLRAFGGAHPGLTFASTGFDVRGTSVVPGVTAGLPMLLATGFWAHGTAGAAAVGPVLGGLAMLAFAGLVARLVGPQWAPAAAILLGISLPEQYVSRSALSEPALQILLFGGLSLLIDSFVLRDTGTAIVRTRRAEPAWRDKAADLAAWLTPRRALAGLAGLAFGMSLLVSVDALLYVLPVVILSVALFGVDSPQALTFGVGLVIGAGYGVADWFLLSSPLLSSVSTQAVLAGLVMLGLIVLCVAALLLRRLRPVRDFVPRMLAARPLRWLPEAGAFLVIAALIGFAIRPYVQTVRGHPSPAVYRFIASLQRMQGLHVDPTRQYSEQTLYWVIWYIGLPTVLLGGFGLALLARRCLRAVLSWRDPNASWRIWVLPLAVFCAGSLVVLWDPAIVPDQPWASRRLVVIVLPGLILCGLWASAWLARWARDRGARPATAVVVGLFCVAAMLVPTAATTFGVGFTHTGKAGGLRLEAKGMALERTGAGESSAVHGLCAQIPRNASVVILDSPTAQRFAQVVRGMCGIPAGLMVGDRPASVRTVIGAIAAAGRRPVLLASRSKPLAGFGTPVRVLDLLTTQDPHELTQLPTSPTPIRFVVWMTIPTSTGVGT